MTFRLFIVVTFFPLVFAQAQEHSLRFEHFGTSHGLSQNSALCMLQDKQGFLWIGTQHGLNRFDGHSFVTYHHDPLDSTSISDNYVVGLAEDTQQRLWVSLLTGAVDVFDKRSGRFEHMRIDAQRLTTPGIPPSANLFHSKSGGMWMGFQTGKLLYLPPELMHLPPPTLLDSASTRVIQVPDAVQSLFEDSRGNIWTGGRTSINLLTRDQDDTQTLPTLLRSWRTGATVYTLHEVSTQPGLLWVGTEDGLRLFNVTAEAFTAWESRIVPNQFLRREPIWSMVEVSPGILWIGTTKQGLFELDVIRRRITHHPHNPANPSGVGGNWITSILADRSGVAWLGLLTGGLSKTLRDSYPFHFIGYDPNNTDGLRDPDVTAILEDRSRMLWVGTRKGGLHRSREAAGTQPFRFRQYPTNPRDVRRLPDPYVKAIHEDRRGSLWVGLWAMPGGLFRADAQREFFTRFSYDSLNSNSLASNLVRVIRDDRDGYLWVGMTGGLSRIHLDSLNSNTFYNYPSKEQYANSLTQDDVFSLLISEKEKEKEVWLGTYTGGVNRLDSKTGTFTHYTYDPSATHYICSNRITTVYEDRRGNIWAGTLSGLALLDRQSDGSARFECFGEEDGLLHNHALAILEDDLGRIWLSTLGGLSRFDPSTRTFTNFHSGAHLPIAEFNVNSASHGGNGRMYFGGVNGFIHFHPDSIRVNTIPPSVAITSVKVFEKELSLDTSIVAKKELRLPYDEDFLSFEFVALDFREQSRNKYAYKMEGINEDWIHIGSRRYVSFSNLEPQEYTFRVKASNNDGVWNEEGTMLRIIIEPPFWMTPWFRVASGAILLLVLTLTIRQISTRKLKRQLHEMEVREKVREERERISTELHDHIGANLTNLATGLEVSQRYAERDNEDKLKDNLSYLEKHTRSTIEALRETIWSLNLESGNAGLLMQRIEDYLEECRRVHTETMLSHSFPGDGKYPLSPAEALNLYRICQEAVNNALKHARATKIVVAVNTETDFLILHISDDGIGFDAFEETAGRSYGLAGIRRRAGRIGAEICIRSAQGGGTVVEVKMKGELQDERRDN